MSAATAAPTETSSPGRGRSRFTLTRLEPSPDLSGHVERHWIVRWSLPEDEPFVYPGRQLSGRVRARLRPQRHDGPCAQQPDHQVARARANGIIDEEEEEGR